MRYLWIFSALSISACGGGHPAYADKITMWRPDVYVCYNVDGRDCGPYNATDTMVGGFEPAFTQGQCAMYGLFPVAKIADDMHITLNDGAVLRVDCIPIQVDSADVSEKLKTESGQQ